MRYPADFLQKSPESVLVGLARSGDRGAFAEIVNRRQDWIRNLMRRCCGDAVLADDLAQQVFLQAWQSIRQLSDARRFPGWLKRVAINTWLQHKRCNDALRGASEHSGADRATEPTPGLGLDLDRALGTLAEDARACVVLAYNEQMTHEEISAVTGLPLGTVKSHIRRGTQKLRAELADYIQAGGAGT